MAKKQPPKKAPETRDEFITAALGQLTLHRAKMIPEPTVRFELGEQCRLGNLEDVRVEEVLEDGKIIVYSYHPSDTRDAKYADDVRHYRASEWWRLDPMVEIQQTNFAKKQVIHDFRSGDIGGMLHSCMYFGVDDNPDFQREYVWTADDKERLLDSVFAGRDIGKFVFVKRPFPENKWVLDGKQRLSTLLAFRFGQLAYKGVHWHQLSNRDQHLFENLRCQYAELDGGRMTRLELLDVFLEMNTGGVPVSPEHIAKVEAMRQVEYERLMKGEE